MRVGPGHSRRSLAVGAVELIEQGGEGQLHVGDDRIPHRGARGFVRIGGDLDQLGTVGQQRSGQVRVVGEDGHADHEDQVVTFQRLADRSDRRRQHAAPVGVALGEAEPSAARGGAGPYPEVLVLGELDHLLPGAGRVDVGPGDGDRVLRLSDALGQVCDRSRVGRSPPADVAVDHESCLGGVHLDVPVIHRYRDHHRTAGRQHRQVDRMGDRERHVFCGRRFEGVLDVRVGDPGRVAVGQVRLEGHQRAHLLSDSDHDRRVVRLGVENRPDGIAEAGGRVEVDQGRLAGDLGVAVGHRHHRSFLEAEYVFEVVGVVLKHRQLGRAGVAEHPGHPMLAEKVKGRFTHGRHGRQPIAVLPPA